MKFTRLRVLAGLALLLATLAATGVIPVGDAVAGTSKVVICHNDGQAEISISVNAIGAHFNSEAEYEASAPGNPLGPHGDYQGPCVGAPVVTPTSVPPTPSPTPSPAPSPTSTMPVFD